MPPPTPPIWCGVVISVMSEHFLLCPPDIVCADIVILGGPISDVNHNQTVLLCLMTLYMPPPMMWYGGGGQTYVMSEPQSSLSICPIGLCICPPPSPAHVIWGWVFMMSLPQTGLTVIPTWHYIYWLSQSTSAFPAVKVTSLALFYSIF